MFGMCYLVFCYVLYYIVFYYAIFYDLPLYYITVWWCCGKLGHMKAWPCWSFVVKPLICRVQGQGSRVQDSSSVRSAPACRMQLVAQMKNSSRDIARSGCRVQGM